MWPRHRALRYYLTSASTGNEDLGKRCLLGTEICSQQSQQCGSFCGSESRFAIHDDPGSRSTIRDPKMVTSLKIKYISISAYILQFV